jgi:TrpR-related protein YerC/YecD
MSYEVAPVPQMRATNVEAEDALLDALLVLKTRDEMRRFLRDVCTPKEMADLADRWWVARLLDAGGHSYRDIHAMTGVSVTTVGRVARFLQQEPYQGYKVALERGRKS